MCRTVLLASFDTLLSLNIKFYLTKFCHNHQYSSVLDVKIIVKQLLTAYKDTIKMTVHSDRII